MGLVGYARASATDPECVNQVADLESAGCVVVRVDRSRARGLASPILRDVLDGLTRGDVLVVTDISVLGLSAGELSRLADGLQVRGARLVSSRPELDTSSPGGKAFFGLLGVFAEFGAPARFRR